MRGWLRRIGIAIVAVGFALVALGVSVRVALAEPRPAIAPGPDAEALADRVAAAVAIDAWAATGAVEWSMFGHRYLWDRDRNLVRYEDRRGAVLTEGWRPMGRAFRDGVEVGGAWKDRRVEAAYASFVNDAFWAFAPTKIRDDGTVRAVVPTDAGPALAVSYPSGGVTPGDLYRWEIGPDGLPVAWSIWASVLPIPGVRFRWSDWVTLDTGARVATVRRGGPLTIRIADLRGAATLAELVPGPDPFAAMY
ncbi:MAG: hypothetical protein ABMB14_12045 [Myxococcota bacterium]